MLKGLLRAIGAVLTAIAIYSVLGFFIVPGVGLRIINQQLANYATVPAKLDRLEFNPFSLELTLWGFRVGEPGKEQVGFDRLYTNLQVDSLCPRRDWSQPGAKAMRFFIAAPCPIPNNWAANCMLHCWKRSIT